MDRTYDGICRPNWEQTVTDQGLTYWLNNLPDGTTNQYWSETEYYSFTTAEIDQMHADAKTLFEMFVVAGDYILAHPEVMDKMQIPLRVRPRIKDSWVRYKADGSEVDWGSVYGRIDARYGGNRHLDMLSGQNHDWLDPSFGRIRLYEFNADTPTLLLETAIIQWLWHEQTKQGKDQWNGIYEDLVDAWKRNLKFVEEELGHKPTVYFACSWFDNLLPELAGILSEPNLPGTEPGDSSYEDLQNLRVLEATCREAGYDTEWRYIQEIHLGEDGRFYDGRHDGAGKALHLDVVFKLHPWEYMTSDAFGDAAMEDLAYFGRQSQDGSTYAGGTLWIEPPYKMLWSNKGLLPVLWKLFGNDPDKSQLLIPAYFDGEQPDTLTSFIRKPIFGREGANVTIVQRGEVEFETSGEYGAEGFIVQEYCPPPMFTGVAGPRYPILGIWYIDGEPSGMGIRESSTVVTDNFSQFVPHVIRD